MNALDSMLEYFRGFPDNWGEGETLAVIILIFVYLVLSSIISKIRDRIKVRAEEKANIKRAWDFYYSALDTLKQALEDARNFKLDEASSKCYELAIEYIFTERVVLTTRLGGVTYARQGPKFFPSDEIRAACIEITKRIHFSFQCPHCHLFTYSGGTFHRKKEETYHHPEYYGRYNKDGTMDARYSDHWHSGFYTYKYVYSINCDKCHSDFSIEEEDKSSDGRPIEHEYQIVRALELLRVQDIEELFDDDKGVRATAGERLNPKPSKGYYTFTGELGKYDTIATKNSEFLKSTRLRSESTS